MLTIAAMEIRRHSILIILLVVVAAVFTSCGRNTIYYKYAETPEAGWEKNDSLTFDVPPVVRPGDYDTFVGIRLDGKYPFKTLHLVVERSVYGKTGKDGNRWSFKFHDSQSVDCRMYNDNGTSAGRGIGYIQYETLVNMPCSLAPGDSIHYTVRHNMKRSILPGIADVGIKLTRCP